MACHARGRCRLCSRKHKIAVFGGEKKQHFFIEQANLNLIILNTVCIACIGKIEHWIKKMDLNALISGDCVKKENEIFDNAVISECENPNQNNGDENHKIRPEESNSRSDIPTAPIPMDVDAPATIETDEKYVSKLKVKSINLLRNRFNDTGDVARSDARTQPQWIGDSQVSTEALQHTLDKKIGQDSSVVDVNKSSCRKRPRYVSKIRLSANAESVERNSEEIESSPLPTSRIPIGSVDCGVSGNCLTNAKKSGRFLGCDYCGKEFTHAGDLNKHRRKHTGEKPYQCNECQRKFAHASNLARHHRVHSGERPFVCTKCTKTFTRKDKLALHVNAARCSHHVDNISKMIDKKILT